MSARLLKPCRARVVIAVAGMTVALALLAWAPAASADGWSAQSVPAAVGSEMVLGGVSCPSPSDCFAVGFQASSGGRRFLLDQFSAGRWTNVGLPGPAGSTTSELDGVSCPSVTFCMAVGSYTTSSHLTLPLALTFSCSAGARPGLQICRWTQRTAQLSAGGQGFLHGVSCTSATFCEAVGGIPGFVTLTEGWNGAAFTKQASGGFFVAELDSVSCTSSTFCVADGWEEIQNSRVPYAESLKGNEWLPESTAGTGQFLTAPSNVGSAVLTGVSCASTIACQVVGGSEGEPTWGASFNGGSWALQSTPPTSGTAFFGQGGVSCAGPSICWAVGDYVPDFGNPQPLGEYWDGIGGWQLGDLPAPNDLGGEAILNSVSCLASTPTTTDCEAVGYYTNQSNVNGIGQPLPMPFAEQYTATVVIVNCCFGFVPHHFSLSAGGLARRGATVTAVLRKPRTLVLLVQAVRHRRPFLVGLVALGHRRAGTARIHWNLSVNGRSLRPGTYQISLSSVTAAVLSPPTAPGEITLTVKPNRRVEVGK
jgi:hypothetical protein